MPIMIDELSTSIHVRDEAKLRQAVREEIEKYMTEVRRAGNGRPPANPADPAAAGGPNETGG